MIDPRADHPAPGRGRITLAIEASNPSAAADPDDPKRVAPGVCLGTDDGAGRDVRILATEPLGGSRHDADLLPAIDRLCTRAGIGPDGIDRVAVSAGPGGYTGLRIAIVAAQSIAEGATARRASQGRPPCRAVAVPSVLVVARRVDPAAGPFLIALASKGRTAWVTAFDRAGAAADEGGLLDADGVERLASATGAGRLVADRFLPDEIRERAEALGLRLEAPVFDPAACLEVSLAFPDLDPALLRPVYPREAEAVRKWRERGDGGPGRPAQG